MKKIALTLSMFFSLLVTPMMGQEYTGPFNHSLMAEKYYDLIVGESSGDRAYYHILDIAPYERDRKSEDYKGLFMESRYVVDKLKGYGFADATTEQLGKTKTWDGVSATLWEVSPKTSKLADYRDLAAILGQGSKSPILQIPLLKHQNTGHNLGSTCHGHGSVTVFFIQNSSRIPIHEHR